MALNINYIDPIVSLNSQIPNSLALGKTPDQDTVKARRIRVKLNPVSTQDFFASGELLKLISVDNGIPVVDIVTAITDDVFCVVENPAPLVQKEKIINGAAVKVYNKGDIINLISSSNETVDIVLQNAEPLVAGDLVEPTAAGDSVQKLTTGKQIGIVKVGNSLANKSVIITLSKI